MRGRCRTLDCIGIQTEERGEEKREPIGGGHEPDITVKQYDKLLESLPDAMVLVSSAGKIVQINTQLVDLFGYAKEDLLGKNLEILMPERFRARHRQNVAGFFASPRRRLMGSGLELFGLKKDGTEFPVDISLSYLTSDSELVAMAAIRDITGR
ncbi:MAG TPA: PAS domain S-box protein, partial [Nitrospirota bacterium]